MNHSKTEVILALDVENRAEADTILDQVGSQLRWVKIGLQSYLRDGPGIIDRCVQKEINVFLDLKLHDIPNTMSKAIESLSVLPIKMLTLHTCAGPEALTLCAETAKNRMPETTLLGVTVLTSMNQENLHSVGVSSMVEEQVNRLACLAESSGIGGVVCSPLELPVLRESLGPDIQLVTPGIRPTGSAKGDQKRIMTPKNAKNAGANYLVIGRPILSASDPAEALAAIQLELK
ncbi:MAG: orotidine-5'-phosphate decarboxylase [Opitutales bacterium]|nr:orotidine-5'-phosphate decarboxylase [Opitutales bacterium]